MGSLIQGEVISLLFKNAECHMPMKYVMLRLDSGDLLPLIFPEFMQHSHMASSVPATVVSAGRIYLENGQIVACGSSSSLGVSSRQEDSEVIQGYIDGKNIIQREQ